ncbi:hypothetical protein HDU92_008291, partial [Lobulomyces angularis]
MQSHTQLKSLLNCNNFKDVTDITNLIPTVPSQHGIYFNNNLQYTMPYPQNLYHLNTLSSPMYPQSPPPPLENDLFDIEEYLDFDQLLSPISPLPLSPLSPSLTSEAINTSGIFTNFQSDETELT